MIFEKVVFEDFIELQRGFDLPEQAREEGDYPVIASTSIVGYHNEFKVIPPCVVTGRSGSLGFVQLIEKPCFPLNTTLFVKDFKGNYPRFVYYFLKTLKLEQYNSGAGVPTLNRNDLDKLEIKIPPVSIQRHIADALGRYDALIENHQRQISLLEAMARELYREWFVRGRCPYAQAQGEGLPDGWERVRLGDILELRYGRSLTEEARVSGNFPVVGSSGIVGYHSEFLVDKPGIVVGRKGNVGSVYWIDKPFYPIDTVFYVESQWSLFYLFFNLQAQNLISGDAAVPGLNREQALFNKMIKPSDDVLERFDKIIRPIFSKLGNLQVQIAKLRRMRDKLLPRLMSGQLEVAGETVL